MHSLGQLTYSRRSDGVPDLDGDLRTVGRAKIRHYRQLYINRPEPIAFMPLAVDTSGRVYDDFSRLLFLHTHREASALTNEVPEDTSCVSIVEICRPVDSSSDGFNDRQKPQFLEFSFIQIVSTCQLHFLVPVTQPFLI